jgi:hypothetical protein
MGELFAATVRGRKTLVAKALATAESSCEESEQFYCWVCAAVGE